MSLCTIFNVTPDNFFRKMNENNGRDTEAVTKSNGKLKAIDSLKETMTDHELDVVIAVMTSLKSKAWYIVKSKTCINRDKVF